MYLVICVTDDSEEWALATHTVFESQIKAETYAQSIDESRSPIVVNAGDIRPDISPDEEPPYQWY